MSGQKLSLRHEGISISAVIFTIAASAFFWTLPEVVSAEEDNIVRGKNFISFPTQTESLFTQPLTQMNSKNLYAFLTRLTPSRTYRPKTNQSGDGTNIDSWNAAAFLRKRDSVVFLFITRSSGLEKMIMRRGPPMQTELASVNFFPPLRFWYPQNFKSNINFLSSAKNFTNIKRSVNTKECQWKNKIPRISMGIIKIVEHERGNRNVVQK